ncbi:hypothetical protein H072_7268 [Dactylellina haptotyla CBS 200.50]|uniref:Uncharacterized protein n=1 Tax=Dactylellina haptotyla (strain CBS 200.50) TaxID=1284197 RepID=S8BUJ4_DACHA|nr:hypothetical protein H072_7268 [Dactylellina haptotyla CBS 200.50]
MKQGQSPGSQPEKQMQLPDLATVLRKLDEDNSDISSAPSKYVRRRRRKTKLEDSLKSESEIEPSSSQSQQKGPTPTATPSTATPAVTRLAVASCPVDDEPTQAANKSSSPRNRKPRKNKTKSQRRQRWREKLETKAQKEAEKGDREDTQSRTKPNPNLGRIAKHKPDSELAIKSFLHLETEPRPDPLRPIDLATERSHIPPQMLAWQEQSYVREPWSSVIVASEDDMSKGLEEYMEELERFTNDWH